MTEDEIPEDELCEECERRRGEERGQIYGRVLCTFCTDKILSRVV